MLDILLVAILSPIALICVIISIAIIFGMLKWIIKRILNIVNTLKKKDNRQC